MDAQLSSTPADLGTPSRPDARPPAAFHLSAGSALARTFQLWGTNFVVLFVLGALIKSPALAVWGLIAFFAGDTPEIHEGLSILANLFRLILAAILEGAVTSHVFRQLVGSPSSIAAAWGTGLANTGAVLGVNILVGLAVLPGCMCLILPGLIVATWLWVSVPVALIEAPGFATALTRSKQLTAGNRWPVFACMAYLGVVRLAAFAVVVATVRAAGGAAVFKEVTTWSGSSLQLTAGAEAIVELLNLPFATLGAVGPAVVYHDLRTGKDGISAEERREILASRFR